MSYWPVELTLDVSILYLLANSKNVYEIAFLVIAFATHVKRQWDARQTIKEVSNRKSPAFILSLLVGALGMLWATRTMAWPIPVILAGLAGVAYFWSIEAFVKDSGERFTLFDPKIDVPQMLISGSMAWIAFRAKNPISIIWLADFVYHVLEAC